MRNDKSVISYNRRIVCATVFYELAQSAIQLSMKSFSLNHVCLSCYLLTSFVREPCIQDKEFICIKAFVKPLHISIDNITAF